MTIDEAIKFLSSDRIGEITTVDGKLSEALKLGIEALKKIKDARCPGNYYHLSDLLGETKKED